MSCRITEWFVNIWKFFPSSSFSEESAGYHFNHWLPTYLHPSWSTRQGRHFSEDPYVVSDEIWWYSSETSETTWMFRKIYPYPYQLIPISDDIGPYWSFSSLFHYLVVRYGRLLLSSHGWPWFGCTKLEFFSVDRRSAVSNQLLITSKWNFPEKCQISLLSTWFSSMIFPCFFSYFPSIYIYR